MTLRVPELASIDRIQVGYGLILERSLGEHWMLSAQTLLGVLSPGAVPLIQNSPDFQSVNSLRAGSNVSLSDSEGVVTITAAGVENHPGESLVLYEGDLL